MKSVTDLYEGHVPLDEAVRRVPLSRYQRIELSVLMVLISLVRPIYWFVRKAMNRPFDVTAGLEEKNDIDTPTRGSRTQETHGGHYLTNQEIEDYELDGVIGPLPLFSPAETLKIRQFLEESHAADWHGKSVLGAEAVRELKENGLWSINHGAIWQERNFKEIRSVAQHRILAERVASLLGDDVVTWRTQAFSVKAKTRGTFWHSATTFTEDGDLPALSAPDHIPEPMVNVSVWIALEDVDKDNGCLRIVPGTHRDIRLDAMFQRFSRDRIGFLMSVDPSELRDAIIALRYSGDIFLAGQIAFDRSLQLVPDLYASVRPAHYAMKAGECLLFSSSCLHGSFPNSSDSQRLAMGIRYTSSDVGIFENQPTIPFNTGTGNRKIDTKPFRSGVPVHTADGPVTPD